jgi:hypothetical protein
MASDPLCILVMDWRNHGLAEQLARDNPDAVVRRFLDGRSGRRYSHIVCVGEFDDEGSVYMRQVFDQWWQTSVLTSLRP